MQKLNQNDQTVGVAQELIPEVEPVKTEQVETTQEEAEIEKLVCTTYEYNDKNFFLKRVATVFGIIALVIVGIVLAIAAISLAS